MRSAYVFHVGQGPDANGHAEVLIAWAIAQYLVIYEGSSYIVGSAKPHSPVASIRSLNRLPCAGIGLFELGFVKNIFAYSFQGMPIGRVGGKKIPFIFRVLPNQFETKHVYQDPPQSPCCIPT